MAAKAKKRAFIYTRLSQDRHGTSESTKRQEADCRALCRREGLDVAHVFSDKDSSAYSGPRPEFTEMLGRLDEVDALVYWKGDRLARRITDFGKVIDGCEQHGVRLVSVVDPIDTSTPMGKGVAFLLSGQAEQESANTSTRVRRMQEDLAAKGKPHGGSRPFGYQAEKVPLPNGKTRTRVLPKLEPAEARAIKTAAKRLVNGGSLGGVATEWNAAGLRTPQRGHEWTAQTVRSVMMSHRIAKLRAYNGDVVGDAEWPAIIDRATYERLQHLFKSRRLENPRSSWAFAGLFYCQRCGGRLTRERRKNRANEIRCHSGPGRVNCGSVSISEEQTEEKVIDTMFAALDDGLLDRASANRKDNIEVADAEKRLAAVERRLAELGEMFGAGEIDRAGQLAARKRLNEDRDAAQKIVARHSKAAAVTTLGRGDLRKRWSKLAADEQRGILRAVIERVVIAPRIHQRREFDPDRISIEWRA